MQNVHRHLIVLVCVCACVCVFPEPPLKVNSYGNSCRCNWHIVLQSIYSNAFMYNFFQSSLFIKTLYRLYIQSEGAVYCYITTLCNYIFNNTFFLSLLGNDMFFCIIFMLARCFVVGAAVRFCNKAPLLPMNCVGYLLKR